PPSTAYAISSMRENESTARAAALGYLTSRPLTCGFWLSIRKGVDTNWCASACSGGLAREADAVTARRYSPACRRSCCAPEGVFVGGPGAARGGHRPPQRVALRPHLERVGQLVGVGVLDL